MSVNWEWIIGIALFGGMSLIAFRYYQGQADRYRDGSRNQEIEKLRGGDGGCCK